MTSFTYRRCRSSLVTILVLPGALGCISLPETPPDNIPIVTDAVETGSQFAANQVLIFAFNLKDAVAKVFLRTASIKIEFHETNPDLQPMLPNPNYPDWPDVDTYLSSYQIYANDHHDELSNPWVIFYVNHYAGNSTTSCGYGGGFTYTPPAANTVWNDPTLRFTFVFVTDIKQHEQLLCTPPATDQELENVLIHSVTHEYGHQRAGLTEKAGADASSYHGGGLPTGRVDVMTPPTTVEAVVEMRAHRDPVFDAFGNEFAGNHLTCRGNLLTNQGVH